MNTQILGQLCIYLATQISVIYRYSINKRRFVMKRLIGIVLICAMTTGVVTACAPAIEIPESETSETTEEGPVRPQDDYYKYINGDTLANAEFEYGENSAASSFDISVVDDQIESIIQDTVSGTGYEKGSEEFVIQTAYNAFMA